MHHPIEQGIIKNWDDIEKIWHHIFYNELRISPEEHPVLIPDSPFNQIKYRDLGPEKNKSMTYRERMQQIMFEVFSVPAFYITMNAVCALYASGRQTGVVLDSGEGITQSVPIYEGFLIPNAIQKVFLAGKDLTEYMRLMLNDRGIKFHTSAESNIVRHIKETMCYVVGDFETAMKEAKQSKSCEKNYILPDGRQLLIGNERFRCAEVLFNPSIAGLDLEGIQKFCFDSIMKCEVDVRRELF